MAQKQLRPRLQGGLIIVIRQMRRRQRYLDAYRRGNLRDYGPSRAATT
jgi:hypothetical protein